MSPLRDLLIAPRPAEPAPPRPRPRRLARRRAEPAAAAGPALGVLAPGRELAAVAIAAGLALARGRSGALVCLHAPGAPPAPPSPRAPARAGAGRLAASLTARGLAAEARGPLAVVHLPEDLAQLATAASRALAAAGPLPTVLAVAQRSEAVDALLGERDAILVALSPAAEPALAGLALAGATALAPSAAAITFALDPVQRRLALAAAWSPRAIRHAIEALVA
jgi:hypothetical protein